MDDRRPVAAEELLLEQRHPEDLGADEALLDPVGCVVEVQAGTDAYVRELR